jgi:hypothetical protein
MHSTIEWLKLLWVCLLRCFLRLDKMNLPQFMKFQKNENKENLTSSWFWVDGGLVSSSFWKYVWKLGCTIIFLLWLLNIQTLYIWHWRIASLHLPLLMIFPNKFKSCRPPPTPNMSSYKETTSKRTSISLEGEDFLGLVCKDTIKSFTWRDVGDFTIVTYLILEWEGWPIARTLHLEKHNYPQMGKSLDGFSLIIPISEWTLSFKSVVHFPYQFCITSPLWWTCLIPNESKVPPHENLVISYLLCWKHHQGLKSWNVYATWVLW